MTNLPTFSALAGAVLAVASTTFNAQAEAIHPILDPHTGATAYCNPWLVPQGMAWMQQQGVPVKAQDAAKQ